MEYVAGGNLDQRLGGMPQPPRPSAQLVETLARAVQHAHQHGIIHRDLKPANVLLASGIGPISPIGPMGSEGSLVPKIADFGLAKQLDAASGRTQTGQVLGTPCYMAPEQAEGKASRIGPATDVYALGAILYECLTGRPPFLAGTTLDTLLLVRHSGAGDSSYAAAGRATRPGNHLLEVPAQGTAPALQQRPGTGGGPVPLPGRRAGQGATHRRPGRLARWCRRNPALTATVAVAAVVVAVVAGVGLTQVLQERTRYRTERDQARTNLYRALVSEARAQIQAPTPAGGGRRWTA